MLFKTIKGWMRWMSHLWSRMLTKKSVPQLPETATGCGKEIHFKPGKKTEVVPGMFLIPVGDEIVRWKCGHECWAQFKLEIYGEILTPKKGALDDRKTCGICAVREMKPYILRCGVCGKPIFPGEPIGLYGKSGSVQNQKSDNQVVGCMRWECGTGAAFAGHWTGRVIKYVFMDGKTAIGVAFQSGKAVMVNDMGDASAKPEMIDTYEGDASDKKGLN